MYGLLLYLVKKKIYPKIYFYLNNKESQLNIKPVIVEQPKIDLKLKYNFDQKTNININNLHIINEYRI